MALVLARGRGESGEVLDRLSVDSWRLASRLVADLELTDFVVGRNPFTGADIRIPCPGAGVWCFRGVNYVVRFECGAVTIDDGHVDMHAPLKRVATHLGATLSDSDTPVFCADRMSLAQLLRRSSELLPATAQAFAASSAFAPDTSCLILEASVAVADSFALALSLGYRCLLGPNEILEQVSSGARMLTDRPSDQLLVDALIHYLNHDAFLERSDP